MLINILKELRNCLRNCISAKERIRAMRLQEILAGRNAKIMINNRVHGYIIPADLPGPFYNSYSGIE
jgi:hypothetical protein